MKARLGPAVVSLMLLSVGYIGALAYLDIDKGILHEFGGAGRATAIVAFLSFAAYILRYLRWSWLLRRRGSAVPHVRGFLSYLAGFALTALPGKLGELIRIRYFAMLGVAPPNVIACFFFERVVDLVAVLLLASLIAGAVASFHIAALFVALVLCAVLLLCRYSNVWRRLAAPLRRLGLRRLARIVSIGGRGLAAAATFLRPPEISVSLAAGLIAFGLQSLGFVQLVAALGISLRLDTAMAVFPLATLIGAASMIPGGIGTMEAATVVILTQFSAPLEAALFAAVAMRLGTLWFAIAVGLLSAIALELRAAKIPSAACGDTGSG